MKLAQVPVDHVNPFTIDEAEVCKRAREALTRPTDASFWDESLYDTHTLAFHTPDPELTDDYLIDVSNYYAAKAELEGCVGWWYDSDVDVDDYVSAASVGHWTYSRYICLKVRVLEDDHETVTLAFRELLELEARIHDYPLLDEDDYCEREDQLRDQAAGEAAAEILSWRDGDPSDSERKILDAVDGLSGEDVHRVVYIASLGGDLDHAHFVTALLGAREEYAL